MSNSSADWSLDVLKEHLQYAVDLEFWTIPYYLTALYSVRDQSSEAFQLIRSVVDQEMLHLELAANVANAYGVNVKFSAPKYGGGIPHLDFAINKPDPTKIFKNWSSKLGPLDAARIDAMCLIEYPEWGAGGLELLDQTMSTLQEKDSTEKTLQSLQHLQDKVELLQDKTKYGSIGAFYNAVKIGAWKFYTHIEPRHQRDDFGRYYANAKSLIIDKGELDGLLEVWELLYIITDQGEGENAGNEQITPEHRNTATDPSPGVDHYGKFLRVREAGRLPETYQGVLNPKPKTPASAAQDTLVENFTAFRSSLEARFAGNTTPDFWTQMATLGANIRTCWVHGAVPRFS
ncbi:MAG: ferritin-like domain-containing protein [Pseudonocardiaceae bacterium]